MYRNIYTSELISLKHNLAHLLSVLEGVHGRLGQQDLPPSRIDLHLLEKGVIPKMLHVIPFLHYSILHGVRDLEHGPRRSCLVSAHNVLDDHAIVTLFFGTENGPSYNRRVLKFGEVLQIGISCSVLHVDEGFNVHIPVRHIQP